MACLLGEKTMADLVSDDGLKYRIVTKKEAALRQIGAAIKLLESKEYEAAITLAGAAEGMMIAHGKPAPLFEDLKDRRPPDFATQTEWILFLNDTLYWLKHNSDQENRSIGEFDAWVMIARALSKYHRTFGEKPQEVDTLVTWGRNRKLTRTKSRERPRKLRLE
jgi:hypothetical protein